MTPNVKKTVRKAEKAIAKRAGKDAKRYREPRLFAPWTPKRRFGRLSPP